MQSSDDAENYLVALEQCIIDGEGDSSKADALRDKYKEAKDLLTGWYQRNLELLAQDLDQASDRTATSSILLALSAYWGNLGFKSAANMFALSSRLEGADRKHLPRPYVMPPAKSTPKNKPKPTDLRMLVVVQPWSEFERGWGCRPDGYSLHLTEEDRVSFIKGYTANRTGDAPDEYDAPDGSPYWAYVKVGEIPAAAVGGVRCYGKRPLPKDHS